MPPCMNNLHFSKMVANNKNISIIQENLLSMTALLVGGNDSGRLNLALSVVSEFCP